MEKLGKTRVGLASAEPMHQPNVYSQPQIAIGLKQNN